MLHNLPFRTWSSDLLLVLPGDILRRVSSSWRSRESGLKVVRSDRTCQPAMRQGEAACQHE